VKKCESAADVFGLKSGILTALRRIQVNHLSSVLLTVLLLPCLLKAASSGTSPNPRVVVLSSDVHYWAKLSKEEVESAKILDKLNDKDHCTYS
jgi:retinol dehydrogenase 12